MLTDEEREAYKAQIAEVVSKCLDGTNTHHGLLIVASNDSALSLYSINVAEEDLPTLISTASVVVCTKAGGEMSN